MSFSPEFLRQMCVDKDAEIERLKAELVKAYSESPRQRTLITELADALENWCVPMRHSESKLIQHAREATK